MSITINKALVVPLPVLDVTFAHRLFDVAMEPSIALPLEQTHTLCG